MKAACREGVFSFFEQCALYAYSLAYRCGFLTVCSLHKLAFATLFKDKKKPLFFPLIDSLLTRLPSLLYLPAYARLQQAQKEGHLTLILSSSPDFLVEKIAKELKVENWHGSCYRISNEGKFQELGQVLDGNAKRKLIEQYQQKYLISKEQTFIYSDSWDDVPFLSTSFAPCAVRPDGRLRKYAAKNNWEILSQ